MKFLTASSRFEQLPVPEKWKLLDNQLYLDDNGDIILCPRNYITDGFTIPNLLSVIAGTKMQYDTRASSQHDFECSYGKVIKVHLTEQELLNMKLLHVYNGMFVCEDIPLEYLEAQKTTFRETNARFARMLKTCKSISKLRYNLITKAVYFNVSWILAKHELNMDELYEVDYGLLVE
jgi:hypothetical protein